MVSTCSRAGLLLQIWAVCFSFFLYQILLQLLNSWAERLRTARGVPGRGPEPRPAVRMSLLTSTRKLAKSKTPILTQGLDKPFSPICHCSSQTHAEKTLYFIKVYNSFILTASLCPFHLKQTSLALISIFAVLFLCEESHTIYFYLLV